MLEAPLLPSDGDSSANNSGPGAVKVLIVGCGALFNRLSAVDFLDAPSWTIAKILERPMQTESLKSIHQTSTYGMNAKLASMRARCRR